MHLLETTRAIKFQGPLPNRYWGECIEAATYIINWISLFVLGNMSPYEILYNKQPSIAHLKVIGCLHLLLTYTEMISLHQRLEIPYCLDMPLARKGTNYWYRIKNHFYQQKCYFQWKWISFWINLREANDRTHVISYSHTKYSDLAPCIAITNEVPVNVVTLQSLSHLFRNLQLIAHYLN